MNLYKIRQKKRIRAAVILFLLLFIVFGLPRILYACKPMIGEEAAIEIAVRESRRQLNGSTEPYQHEKTTCRILGRNDATIFSWLFGRCCYEVFIYYKSPDYALPIGVLVDCYTGEIITE